ncbi:MAG: hypothetical protein J5973_03045, partial [Eubacterium sp.]|nr:hypothetical protein [Eubacterium sp.]
FREKNLKRAMGTEGLDQGIRVTSYRAWIVVAAGFLIVAAIIVGALIADIRDVVHAAGFCENGTLTAYFRVEDVSFLEEGMDVTIDGRNYKLDRIEKHIFAPSDLPGDILYFSPKGSWYQTAAIRCDLEDGIYQLEVPLGKLRLLSFMSSEGK